MRSKTIVILTAALTAAAASFVLHNRARSSAPSPIVSDVTTERDVAHDVSGRLAPPADADRDRDDADADADAQQGRGEPPPIPVLSVPTGAAGIEQTKEGTKPSATLVESFDGLGAGFTGPQGPGRGG